MASRSRRCFLPVAYSSRDSPSMYSVMRYQSPSVVLPAQIDLHHVWMVDLAQRADLPADGFVAGGVVEELERTLLAFDFIENAVDLRETALAKDVEDLEPAVDDVAHWRNRPPWLHATTDLCRIGLR